MSLIQTLQQHFGYPPLKKIDPNTQEVKQDEAMPMKGFFGQAAIPAVLIGLYKYSITDEGAAAILRGGYSTDWVKKIFGEDYDTVVDRISGYSGETMEKTAHGMHAIAVKSAELLSEGKKRDDAKSILTVKETLASQRQDILSHLPAALQVGELLHDDTVDDRTNKMEGPISSLMQKIGVNFSQADMDEKKSQVK